MTAADPPAAGSSALNAPIRSREAVALDLADRALRHARQIIMGERQDYLATASEIERALVAIAELQQERTP